MTSKRHIARAQGRCSRCLPGVGNALHHWLFMFLSQSCPWSHCRAEKQLPSPGEWGETPKGNFETSSKVTGRWLQWDTGPLRLRELGGKAGEFRKQDIHSRAVKDLGLNQLLVFWRGRNKWGLKYCCNSGDFFEIHLLLLRGKSRMLHSPRANRVVFSEREERGAGF